MDCGELDLRVMWVYDGDSCTTVVAGGKDVIEATMGRLSGHGAACGAVDSRAGLVCESAPTYMAGDGFDSRGSGGQIGVRGQLRLKMLDLPQWSRTMFASGRRRSEIVGWE
jgi:hypothetical protein